jgi:serine/threonine protein kinase
MGVVLKAHDPRLNRVVAIKVLSPALASNAAARKRFLREAQAAAAVTHDHVVAIYAIDEAKHLPYLVMEFVAGQSLQQKIDAHGPLAVQEIVRIGRQIAAGLAAAHTQGLIHRDIKPANILLENGVERVKITDFGLARAVGDVGVTQTGLLAGTPQYMSPEQAHGERVDAVSRRFAGSGHSPCLRRNTDANLAGQSRHSRLAGQDCGTVAREGSRSAVPISSPARGAARPMPGAFTTAGSPPTACRPAIVVWNIRIGANGCYCHTAALACGA